MSRLWIPAIHLPHGKEVFRPLPYRPSLFKRVLKSYADRALLQCGPRDAVVLPQTPDRDYLDFLLGLGLGTENIITCSGNADNFAQDILSDDKTMEAVSSRAQDLGPASFYIHLEEEGEIARRIGRAEAVMHPDLTRLFNRIYFLVRLEEDLELKPIKRFQIRSSRFGESAGELLGELGPLFVRGNESVGGSQVFIIKSPGDVDVTEKKILRNRQITRYFASRLLENPESWNVQYDLTRDGFSHFGTSRQMLDEGAHRGNRWDGEAPRCVLQTTEPIVRRLWEMGAAGMVGIDLIIHEGGAFTAEINARQNTSTPVVSVLRKISGNNAGEKIWFESFGLDVGPDYSFRDFKKLAGEENLLDLSGKSGLLPYHFGSCRHTGRMDVAAFSRDPGELDGMVRRLRASAGSL